MLTIQTGWSYDGRMKLDKAVTTLLVLATAAFAGCKKKAPPPPQATTIGGVKVDAPRLAAELATAGPEAKTALTDFQMALRYQMYERALAPLDKLANDPTLNESQKKVVNDVIEQIKQLIQQKGTAR